MFITSVSNQPFNMNPIQHQCHAKHTSNLLRNTSERFVNLLRHKFNMKRDSKSMTTVICILNKF
jgi:hypothetical protein